MSQISKNLAATMAADAIYVGGNWGFMLKNNIDYQRTVELLREDREVSFIETQNGVIVFSDYKYLLGVLNQVGAVTSDVQIKIQQREKEASADLGRLMQDILNGRSKYGISGEGYKEVNIALYSCNTTNKIRVNGVEYPAFPLTVMEACKEIVKYSKNVPIYLYIGDSFEEIHNFKKPDDINKILRNLEIANSLNGAFLTIRLEIPVMTNRMVR